jgi:hypothetical protein
MEPTLAECRPPWVVVTRADDPWVDAAVADLQDQGGMVVRVPGRELHSPSAIFTVFARALSFPGYFGHNWNALVDCLHDWHGHETAGQGLAILIEDADRLAQADFLGVLFSVLCEAGWKANLQLDADGIPHENWPRFPWHVVFLVSGVAPGAFASGAASGADVDAALVDGRLIATLTGADWPGSAPVTP